MLTPMRLARAGMRTGLLLIGVCLGLPVTAQTALAQTSPTLDAIRASQRLRVCILPDYYGITYRHPLSKMLTGLDIDLSEAFARDLGVQLQYVDTSLTTLIDDLQSDACNIAMFALAETDERRQRLVFSIPYLEGDVYAVAHRGSTVVHTWEDIDKPGVRVAVAAGSIFAALTSGTLKHAERVVVTPPMSQERELQSGRVDVFLTNFTYSRRLAAGSDWARLIAPSTPFHDIPYAYAMKQGDPHWVTHVNAFVTAAKQDGRLMRAARKAGLEEMVTP